MIVARQNTFYIIFKVLFSWLVMLSSTSAESLRYYDAHIHYDEDVWQSLSPAEAVKMLRQQSVDRAMVSATPMDGAERLYRYAPDFVIPMLRPYRSWRHRYFWFKDPELIGFLTEQLNRIPYVGLGEFHIFGDDVLHKPFKQMLQLARERQLVLHPHIDLKGMQLLLKNAEDLVVIWAHGGFDVPVKTLDGLMQQYPKLYIELSLRDGMTIDNETLRADWKNFLVQYRQRVLIGSDTYKPARWADLPETYEDIGIMLKQLPVDVAEDIARNNVQRLFR